MYKNQIQFYKHGCFDLHQNIKVMINTKIMEASAYEEACQYIIHRSSF